VLPRVGISHCLLGERVRYDGGHKRSEVVTGVLGSRFQWVAVCPEVDVGMGVPREPVRLIDAANGPRMVGVRSRGDWTDEMRSYSRSRADRLAVEDLSGFVFKQDSPSCGMSQVEVWDDRDTATRAGVGLFAAALMKRLPNLPVEDEGRLQDHRVAEDFVDRVYAYQRWINENSC